MSAAPGPNHIVLLRGVNVGGRNPLGMGDFKACLEAVGCTGVVTYIQSGNAVCRWEGVRTADLAALTAEALRSTIGTVCEVVVLDAPTIRSVITANPYPNQTGPEKLHVVFSSRSPTVETEQAVRSALEKARVRGSADEAMLVGGSVYLQAPDGFGRSILASELARAEALRPSTVRNWATVTRLASMLGP